jgi:DNA-binding MarR family transcriptional regulator
MQQMHDAITEAAAPEACAALLLEVAPLVMRVIRRQMRGSRSADLSVPQFRALGFIARRPGSSLGDLAEHIGLSPAAASRLVDGLVARGYAERRDSTADRRLVELRVAPAGAAILETTRTATRSDLAVRVAVLSEEQRAAVVQALGVLRELFAAEGRSPATEPAQS